MEAFRSVSFTLKSSSTTYLAAVDSLPFSLVSNPTDSFVTDEGTHLQAGYGFHATRGFPVVTRNFRYVWVKFDENALWHGTDDSVLGQAVPTSRNIVRVCLRRVLGLPILEKDPGDEPTIDLFQ